MPDRPFDAIGDALSRAARFFDGPGGCASFRDIVEPGMIDRPPGRRERKGQIGLGENGPQLVDIHRPGTNSRSPGSGCERHLWADDRACIRFHQCLDAIRNTLSRLAQLPDRPVRGVPLGDIIGRRMVTSRLVRGVREHQLAFGHRVEGRESGFPGVGRFRAAADLQGGQAQDRRGHDASCEGIRPCPQKERLNAALDRRRECIFGSGSAGTRATDPCR